ncbi:MAG: hypothetical protein KDC34_16270, partial [Saprospiraceae bacterium]|nr:hypothetical protein [Saprospiraceae bacterium]
MKTSLYFLLFICLFSSCGQEASVSEKSANAAEPEAMPPAQHTRTGPVPDVLNLVKPIALTGAKTTLILEDFFTDCSKIDSVAGSSQLGLSLSPDHQKLDIRIIGDVGFYESIRFYLGTDTYDFLLTTPTKVTVTLRLRDNGFREVALKGEMNAWNPANGKMTLNAGVWETTFEVQPGNYQYLFVADGEEIQDPKNPKKVSNGMGGENSLLALKQANVASLPQLETLDSETGVLRFKGQRCGRVYAFLDNHLLETEKSGDTYTLKIPEAAASRSRSYIRIFAANEYGIGNDLLLPLSGREIIRETGLLNRSDQESQIMYFVLVDRFMNGDTGNDAPVDDERVLPKCNYMGGDLAGLSQKINSGYLDQFNINSIWLSPITQNPEGAFQEYPEPRRFYTGYHGYWPVFSAKVDHRFGDDQRMRELVAAAHEADINILLDFVCNHVHEQHTIYQNHPDWVTNRTLENGEPNIRIWEEQRLTTWFDSFLPSLDLSREEVIVAQADSALYWVKTFGLDGFRHDATKHIPEAFWRYLTRKIKTEIIAPEDRSIYQIGETYGSRELISSYISSGLLDAQFDFNLYFDAREAFAKPETSFEDLVSSMRETFKYYGFHSTMGYISGNHDAPRFISYAGGDLTFDEDSREAGFEREVGVGDPVGYKRLAMLHAFNFSIPGIPVIFYGDEIGMPGAGDPDNRRMMRFEGLSPEETKLRDQVARISGLRAQSMALIYGDTRFEQVSQGT